MTFSGSNITQWRDKSASNNNVTAGGTGYPFLGKTTTGKQCINFIGSNYFSADTTNMTGGSTTLFITAYETTNTPSLYVWCYSGNTRIVRSDLYYNGANNFFFSQNFFGGSNAICTIIENVGGSAVTYFNGVQNVSAGASAASSNAGIQIGSFWNTSITGPFWVGNIQEIIYYNSALNTTQQQQVEQYLAFKWGLVSQMGTSHPGYKPRAPPFTLTPYTPLYSLTYTGDYIYFTVPTNATGLTFYMWGAGGGFVSNSAAYAGGGAFLTGTLAVSPGEQIRIIVGMGGKVSSSNFFATGTDAQGGGGGGGFMGGMGGGRSAIQKYISNTWTEVVTAGGGGGAANNANDFGGNAYYTGTSQSAGLSYWSGSAPGGGSATAAGTGVNITGQTYNYPSNNGGPFYGGAALNNIYGGSFQAGGGGGGGYYGGGGGGTSTGFGENIGGGGGGSYYNATYITNFSGSNGNNITAVASSYSFYDGAAGRASATNSVPGSNGLVVFAPSYTRVTTSKTVYPIGPYVASANSYTTTGSNYYTVPATAGGAPVKGVYVYLWGAGGAIGAQSWSSGGGGGFVSGFYSCNPGTNLIYVVGSVGGSVASNGGGGCNSQTQTFTYAGGFSGLFLSNAGGIAQSNAIAMAGGGGGGGWDGPASGGGGGYPSGGNGSLYSTMYPSYSSATCGTGGSQTAAGIAGGRHDGNGVNSLAGSALLGGVGGYEGGGGPEGSGGGGWYGGGGGGYWGGGGGGSSYIGNVGGATGGIGLTSSAYYENGFDWNTSVPANPGGTTNQFYVSGKGVGNGGTGLVVIVPATTQYPTPLSIYN